MKKIVIVFFLLFFPFVSSASEEQGKFYTARVTKILEQKNNVLSDGQEVRQQKLQLNILDEGEEKTIVINGIGDFDTLKNNLYKEGDRVLVVRSISNNGEESYYITDYHRENPILLLAFIFVLIVLLVSRFKGLRALISLAISFLVLTSYLIPAILAGSDPLLTTLIASLIIIVVVIYLTEGFNKLSSIAILGVLIGLFVALFLSWFFVELAYLSGVSSEDVFYLVSVGSATINFKGLLFAGIIIGTLGVLDDVVISQIKVVEQLYKANKNQSRGELFKKAHEVGVSHIGSMINTLFLAYTGVSLPLLILFISGNSAFNSWWQIINNEQIATEIVRTLTGSIGLVLSVPITTAIAIYFISKKTYDN